MNLISRTLRLCAPTFNNTAIKLNSVLPTRTARLYSFQTDDDNQQHTKLVNLVRQSAPDFSGTAVVNGHFKQVTLQDFANRYLVLFFYPLDFTFVCPTELIAFHERYDEFEQIGCSVVGVSTDSHFSHLAWMEQSRNAGGLGGHLAYPLLSDYNKVISARYGVLLREEGFALRGTFIIDRGGVVRHSQTSDLGLGRSVEETLRCVKALQFSDTHGEVCPANWKEGEQAIKPNKKDAQQFFEKQK